MSAPLATVPDHVLLRELDELIAKDQSLEADLLLHLGEVEARELHLELGFPSMFSYCTASVLHFSEATAYHRIQAARAARVYPAVLDRVRRGEIHLTGVKLLAPHLTPREPRRAARPGPAQEQARDRGTARRSSAEAGRAVVRAEARRSAHHAGGAFRRRDLLNASSRDRAPGVAEPTRNPDPSRSPCCISRPQHCPRSPWARTASRSSSPRAAPFARSSARPRLCCAIRFPDGDLAEIFDRALTLLVQDAKRKKFAQTDPDLPRVAGSEEKTADGQPRVPPHPGRDQARGRRPRSKRALCVRLSSRATLQLRVDHLEFHHKEAWAKLKRHSTEGIELRCRAHNQYAAVQDFGADHMSRCLGKEGVAKRPLTGSGTSWTGDWSTGSPRRGSRPTKSRA